MSIGGGQLGLCEAELPQLDDFAGLGAWRANGAFGHAQDCICGIRRASAKLTSTATAADAIRQAKRNAPPKSVLIIGSEALPFSKTGGLADVLGALPPALARLGWDVTLVIPQVSRM